jgi:hypothetical protein
MSKSSSRSRPSESVFGALGPDDAYFGNRVQAAARDAQQRWPLLGGLAPSAAEETPALTEGDKARWQPQPPLVPSKPAISRPSLSKKLESGLGRLTQQASADTQHASQRRRSASLKDDAPEPVSAPHAARAVRAATTQPTPLAEDFAPVPGKRMAPRRDPSESARMEVPVARARASAPAQPAPREDKSLGGLFRRLSNQAEPSAPGSSESSGKSILGRLGKR